MTLLSESDYSNKNAIVLNPSRLYRRYRIALLLFSMICLWQVFNEYTLIFSPLLIWAVMDCFKAVNDMVIYPSTSEWGLAPKKGVYHRFNIIKAWFATGCIVLTIHSKTYQSKKLLILKDQVSPFQFKHLIFEIKKKLFIQG